MRDAIEQRYREEGSWEALIELYLNRIDVSAVKEKVELLNRVADVFARELGDPDQAHDALLGALELEPSDDETVAALEEIARREERWPRLVAAVKAKLENTSDEDRELRYAELLTRWCRNELKDKAAAEPFLEHVRRIDPSHPLVHRRLASVYRKLGAWDAQRDALLRALIRTKKDVDRRPIHVALGELFEHRAKNHAKAHEHYAAALAIDASCMEALRGEERICRIQENCTMLATVLERQVDAAATNEERVGVLLRLADLHERTFVKPQSAAPKLELVLEFEPTHEGAFDGLERCYQATRAWADLVKTLERRASVSVHPLEVCDFLMRVAEVHESKRADTDAALEAYRRVYALDSGHRQALVELARLCEKKKDWSGAAAYRSRAADLIDDPRVKAQVHVQIGDSLMQDERDPSCARAHYEKAVEMDPGNVAAWDALHKLALRSSDGMYAVFCLEKRANNTESTRHKGQLLVELAKLRASLGDARGAFATYDYALKTDPTNEAAGRAVFEDYVRAERWAEASPVCEQLINAATRDGDSPRVFALLRVATTIASALGNDDRAILAAVAAFEMRPDDHGAKHALLEVCHRVRHDAAARARTADAVLCIARTASELPPSALVRLAEIHLARGEEEAAVDTLCRALALDAGNKGALANLADVFVNRADWQRASNCKQRLALATSDEGVRRELVLETAELWEKKARNLPKAALLLEGALASAPHDATLLHRLVAIYQALGIWEKLASTLRVIADLEPDPGKRARTLYGMAGIAREKLADGPRAAALYGEVLDLDASRLDAFEHVVRIHTERHAWTDLRDAYEAMLRRLDRRSDVGLKYALHHQLGLVYRDRLGDVARALDAFRCASQLKPERDEDRKIVIELLVSMDRVDVAISTTRAAIGRDPLRASQYREICELFLSERATDKAWCAVDVLAHLNTLDGDEARFLHAYPKIEIHDIPGTLAPSAWASHILHPDLDARLSSILRIVTPAILRMRLAAIPASHRAALLGARLDPESSESAGRLTRLVENAAEVLGMPMPALYDRPTMPMPFAVAPTPAPALFVSTEAADAIPRDLLPFLVARRIGELRPDLAAHALFPTQSELRGLLKAAVRVAVAGASSPSLKPEERALARAMHGGEMEALRAAVSLVVDGAPRVDIKRWLQLVDVSLSRASLLLSGSFDTAWRAVQREARAPGDLALAEWRGEMLHFAVSDEYSDLRGAVGISLDCE